MLDPKERAAPGSAAPGGSTVASKRQPPVDAPPMTSEVERLNARIAALEARDAEHERSERVQAALYRIAEAASAASDLQAFYREVHATVGTLMYAENFYIALYDEQRQAITSRTTSTRSTLTCRTRMRGIRSGSAGAVA